MKTKTFLIMSALLTAWAVHAADRIDPQQVPAPVKSALGSSAQDQPVKEITIHNVDGRTVYDVELERDNAPNSRLRVAADGSVLRDTRRTMAPDSTTTPSDLAVYGEYPAPAYIPKLKLGDLPPAVQRTVNKEAAGREIGEITSDIVDGHPAYKIEFRERGVNPRFFVGENGALLRPPEKPPVLGIGTTFARTPTAVQQTIRREIGEGEITKIDKEGLSGPATIYKVEVKEKDGTTFELRIGDNGKVLNDTRRQTAR
jgi:uncharacterized membrane protein YkoI